MLHVPSVTSPPPRPMLKMAVQCPVRLSKKLSYFLRKAPLDVLENIVRLSSPHPNYEHWASFLRAPELEKILHANKSLARIARRIVKKVDIADYPLACPRGIFLNGICSSDQYHFCSFLTAFRTSIEDIRVHTSKFEAYYSDIISCPNIQSLALSSARIPEFLLLGAILPKIGRQLKSLEVSFPMLTHADTEAIAGFCGSLNCLSLNCIVYEISLNDIWNRIGPHLTKLFLSQQRSEDEIQYSNFKKMNLGTIEALCKSITSLSVARMPSCAAFQESFCSLATALGHRLTEMSLDQCNYPADLLERICTQCPAVRVDLSERCGVANAAAVSLGNHARTVTIGCHHQFNNGLIGIEGIGEACQELESVRFRCETATRDVMFSFFKYPKMRLREVHAHFGHSGEIMTLGTLGKIAPALEVFHIIGGLWSLQELLDFVDTSESILEIAIENVPHNGGCRCSAEDENGMPCTNMTFANAIAVCTFSPTLRYLRLSCDRSFHRLQNVRAEEFLIPCGLAQRKSISVCVCGYRYV